jgi:hypothetical protein
MTHACADVDPSCNSMFNSSWAYCGTATHSTVEVLISFALLCIEMCIEMCGLTQPQTSGQAQPQL